MPNWTIHPILLLLSQPSFPFSDVYCQTFFIIDVYCQTIPIPDSVVPSVSPAGPLAPTLSHFSRLCLTRLSLRSMQLTAASEVLHGGLWFLDAKRHKKTSLYTIRSFLFFLLPLSVSPYDTLQERDRKQCLFGWYMNYFISYDSKLEARYGRTHVSCIMQVYQWGSEIWLFTNTCTNAGDVIAASHTL